MEDEGSTKGAQVGSDYDDYSDGSSSSDDEPPEPPQKTLTRAEIKRLLKEMKSREKLGEVKHSGANTGGIAGLGKGKKRAEATVEKAPKIKSTVDYANKFKINI